MASQQFGKYRLIERIAVGGTAEVFRAALVWPDGHEDPVVLKKILPQHARDRYFRRLFREEALVVASLQHPNIVQIRDFGQLQGTFFLALEYVDGADLDTLLDSGEGGAVLDAGIATTIASKICSALDYIHTRKSSQQTPLRIVHRDISPHNILISRRGEVKLADFGIAKSIIRAESTTEGTIKGKFAYMSPEQASPGEEIDAGTDLFSLGAVLYEMLFGAPPFRGRTDVETLERVRHCDYKLDEDRLPAPHRPLASVLRRCLLPRGEGRYPDAAVLGRDLDEHLTRLGAAVEAAEIASWVDRSIREGVDSSMNQLVSDMLGVEPRAGGTAMLPAGGEPPDRETTATAPPKATHELSSPPAGPSRGWVAALVVAVAGITALVTLIASGFFGRTATPPAGRSGRASGVDAASLTAADAITDGSVVILNTAAMRRDARVPAPPDAARGTPVANNVLPRKPRRALPGRRRRPRGHGRLTINSIPWARVYLEGRLLGITPLRAVRVPAGTRRITLKDSAGRVLRSFQARIPRGGARTFSFDDKR